MTIVADVDPAEVADRWESWAARAEFRARLLTRQGDRFGAALKRARGVVRGAAAALLRDTPDVAEAARLMMERAGAAIVHTAPLIGFDEAAESYTKARTWQACARELDPTITEVQERWD